MVSIMGHSVIDDNCIKGQRKRNRKQLGNPFARILCRVIYSNGGGCSGFVRCVYLIFGRGCPNDRNAGNGSNLRLVCYRGADMDGNGNRHKRQTGFTNLHRYGVRLHPSKHFCGNGKALYLGGRYRRSNRHICAVQRSVLVF